MFLIVLLSNILFAVEKAPGLKELRNISFKVDNIFQVLNENKIEAILWIIVSAIVVNIVNSIYSIIIKFISRYFKTKFPSLIK
jgi:hypothetical protein